MTNSVRTGNPLLRCLEPQAVEDADQTTPVTGYEVSARVEGRCVFWEVCLRQGSTRYLISRLPLTADEARAIAQRLSDAACVAGIGPTTIGMLAAPLFLPALPPEEPA